MVLKAGAIAGPGEDVSGPSKASLPENGALPVIDRSRTGRAAAPARDRTGYGPSVRPRARVSLAGGVPEPAA